MQLLALSFASASFLAMALCTLAGNRKILRELNEANDAK